MGPRGARPAILSRVRPAGSCLMHAIVHLIVTVALRGGKRAHTCLAILSAVLVATFCSLLVTELTVNAIYQDDQFYSTNAWPKSVALGIPGCLFLIGGTVVQHPRQRVLGFDFESGQEIVEVKVSPNRLAYLL